VSEKGQPLFFEVSDTVASPFHVIAVAPPTCFLQRDGLRFSFPPIERDRVLSLLSRIAITGGGPLLSLAFFSEGRSLPPPHGERQRPLPFLAGCAGAFFLDDTTYRGAAPPFPLLRRRLWSVVVLGWCDAAPALSKYHGSGASFRKQGRRSDP